MSEYSKDIIQINDDYIIKNYSKVGICLYYVLIIFFLLFLIFPILSIINLIKDKGIGEGIFEVLSVVPLLVFFALFISTKKIIINNKEKNIVFKYGLIPFLKIRKLEIDKIKEISINYIQDTVSFSQYKEKIYNVDLVDNEQCSYTLFQSEVYNEDLIDFANKIGKIINKKVEDKNTVGGYNNIYKKNII